MYCRATEPYNQDALRIADDKFYAAHPEYVQNGQRIPLSTSDPVALRSEWMDYYKAAGGTVVCDGDPSEKPPEDPVERCPYCGMGNLMVQVVDEQGIPIPGAEVNVPGLGTLIADENGWVDYGPVDPGEYEVWASAGGYSPLAEPGSVNVIEDTTTTTQIVLQREPTLPEPEKKYVYLTFDDGPEAGTKEVYELLKSKGIRGTFFIVGEHAEYYENHVEAGFLRKLATGMEIANHSHTHAHDLYSSYYDSGIMIDPVTLEPDATSDGSARRSVLMDFEYASIAMDEVISKANIPRPINPSYDFRGTLPVSNLNYRRTLRSRMPGTNVWRLPGIHYHAWTSNPYKNMWPRLDEADELWNNSYRIYGWDYEFDMSFELHDILDDKYRAGEDPHLDLYSDAYIDLDRPTISGDDIFGSVKSEFESPKWIQKPNKLILLMHERAFRRYRAGDEKKYLAYLERFIDLCQAEGYIFDVISNY